MGKEAIIDVERVKQAVRDLIAGKTNMMERALYSDTLDSVVSEVEGRARAVNEEADKIIREATYGAGAIGLVGGGLIGAGTGAAIAGEGRRLKGAVYGGLIGAPLMAVAGVLAARRGAKAISSRLEEAMLEDPGEAAA